jgi:hypothetical protein
MALEAIINQPEFQRVILEEYAEGVYILVFKPGEEWPCRDHLQDNWAIAKLQALEDYGVTDEMWREVPDTGIMG